MKPKFILPLLWLTLAFAVPVYAATTQGVSVRAQDGIATNLTHTGGSETNIGSMLLHLGANASGSAYSIADTNGLFRLLILGRDFFIRDTNIIRLRIEGDNFIQFFDNLGNSAFVIKTNGLFGNGAGLSNIAQFVEQVFQTNVYFNQTSFFNYLVVTNVAVFNGKVTMNSLTFPTNAWAGPTNTLNLGTNYQFFTASTDCAITAIAGPLAGVNTWSTLTVSNSTALPITVRSLAPGIRAQGSSTTAALLIGAGKEGYLTYHARDVRSTNFVTTTEQ